MKILIKIWFLSNFIGAILVLLAGIVFLDQRLCLYAMFFAGFAAFAIPIVERILLDAAEDLKQLRLIRKDKKS